MFNPAAGYSKLIHKPGSTWTAFRRPLFTMLVLACAISLMTSGRVTARLAAPSFLCWTFVPLFEIAGLAVVWRRRPSFSEAVDLFFIGNAPGLLWFIAYSALFAFLRPIRAFAWMRPSLFNTTLLAALFWMALIDFRFFRIVFRRTPAQAARDLLVQRAISWGGTLLVFAWSSIWPIVLPGLGL
jgi:hypothetical protein